MPKIDFANVLIKDIEGHEIRADFKKQLGNQLYMQGQNIEECELGKRIYFAQGDVELTDKDCAIVRNAVQGYSYIARSAIENQLKKE